MIISKKALPRRTFLRGLGTTLALPLLDAMVPAATALAATPAKPVRRLGYVYIPMGSTISQWTPPGPTTPGRQRRRGIAQDLESAANVVQIACAGLGEREPLLGAQEKLHAELAFQRLQLTAHRPLGQ